MISQNSSEQKQNDEKCYHFLENFMPWDQNIPLKPDVSSPSGNTAKLCIKVAMYEKNFSCYKHKIWPKERNIFLVLIQNIPQNITLTVKRSPKRSPHPFIKNVIPLASK